MAPAVEVSFGPITGRSAATGNFQKLLNVTRLANNYELLNVTAFGLGITARLVAVTGDVALSSFGLLAAVPGWTSLSDPAPGVLTNEDELPAGYVAPAGFTLLVSLVGNGSASLLLEATSGSLSDGSNASFVGLPYTSEPFTTVSERAAGH